MADKRLECDAIESSPHFTDSEGISTPFNLSMQRISAVHANSIRKGRPK